MAQGSVRSRGVPFLHVLSLTPAGTTQATATAIVDASPGIVLAAGDSWTGIRLPTASRGKTFWVKNTGTKELGRLRVYPATGDQINALAVNAYIQMEEETFAMFVAISSTVWYSLPLLPS